MTDQDIITSSIWTRLVYPLAPNEANVKTYDNLIVGDTVLLLGCTKLLLPLANEAIDMVSRYPTHKIRVCNWLDYLGYNDTVLIDGGLNLTEELCNGVLNKYKTQCSRLISRCFTKRHPDMTFAQYFPSPSEFIIAPHIYSKSKHYMFCVWDF